MDIQRAPAKKGRKQMIYGGIALAAILATTLGLRSLKPAAPRVDRAAVWIDSVQRGPLVIEVRGPGTLVPERIRYISAVTAGRVEKRLAEPGQKVEPETVLLELSNPDVQLEALESERQLTVAQADRVNLKATLRSQLLNQEAVVATAKAAYMDAKRTADASEGLAKQELISSMEASRAIDRVEELETRFKVEAERLNVMTSAADSQMALQVAQVGRLYAVTDFQRGRVRSMVVKAGASGILQELPLEVGQWAQSGATLARLVEPGKLKAVLRIPETQAKDVVLGQPASIDTRNGIVKGKVMRIDPAVQNGTVTVDVSLEGELPKGARPDLSVDGTIQVERLDNVLHVGRPSYGQAEGSLAMFRVVPGGGEARRVMVRLGRGSASTVEVLSGLNPGDVVILSDLSQYEGNERLKLR